MYSQIGDADRDVRLAPTSGAHFLTAALNWQLTDPLAGDSQDADRCICISQDFKDRRALLRGSQRIMR